MMKFKTKGFKKLDAKLGRLSKSFSRSTDRQIEVGAAQLLLDEMMALAPVRSGELRNSLAIVEGDLQVYVGPTRPGGRHAHFNEFGTIYMDAQPFIRPAYDNTEDAIVAEIGREVIAVIDEARRD